MIVDATIEVLGVGLFVTLSPPGARASVEVGELGRHGHQGYVADRWATFSGADLGAELDDDDIVRLHFVVPDGWEVASPIPPEGAPWSVVREACFGLGHLRSDLDTGVEALRRWFSEELGFAPPSYAVVLTPDAPDGRGVYAGSSALGTCFDHDGGRRDWELLAHRMAHAVDRHPPAFRLSAARDAWFVEGWASYVEVVATEATGLAPDRRRLDELAAAHREALARHPEWDVPLASEPHQRGELREHLHYVAGPLVAARLDATLLARTGRDLQAFVRHLHTQRQGATVDLRAELRAWSGASLEDFWAQWVDRAASL